MHTLPQTEERKNGGCAIKLDMVKVYDRVEWDYLEGMMMKLRFHAVYVSSIMRSLIHSRFDNRISSSGDGAGTFIIWLGAAGTNMMEDLVKKGGGNRASHRA